MTTIRIDGEPLDVYSGFAMEIEDTSPVFNDAGSQTLAFTVPATPRNSRLLGFPGRPDSVGNGVTRRPRCVVESGSYLREGVVNIDGSADGEISINIGFDNSIAYEAWNNRKLSELDSLPCQRWRDVRTLADRMNAIYMTDDPGAYDVAVFPIVLDMDSIDEKSNGAPDYWETLSPWALWAGDGSGPVRVERLIDGELTKVTVPYGYGCSPFVKVWKILECVFADLGLTMDCNPFREDDDLKNLVVLNNTADALCTGVLDYRELMPDCTVEEFLHSLFVRFGMVYRTDFNRMVATVRLVRDIAALPPETDLDAWLAESPAYEFRTPSYVRLAAATSIEGAEPLTERLEDFMQGCSAANVFVGEAVDIWPDRYPEAGVFPDTRSPSPAPAMDPDAPEFVEIPRSEKPQTAGYRFTWDRLTGKWYRVSELNGYRATDTSSGFFVWDPQPEGYDPLDLTSVDDCCPVAGMVTQTNPQAASQHVVMPTFLCGSRHFHTYVESAGNEERGECPLSFMFAVTGRYSSSGSSSATFGRLSTGGTHLWFQLRGGLYDRYWRSYDHALRNADRSVSAVCMMSKDRLRGIDILRPVMLKGVPMLIDTMSATIGDSRLIRVELTLMPVMAVGPAPDEVPGFPPEAGVL